MCNDRKGYNTLDIEICSIQYCVLFPRTGHDGKAGMAAIVIMKGHRLDLHNIYSHVVKSLPLYAYPKFLRILKEMDITVTFKHRKNDLAKDGFDLNVISDPLFFLDTERKTYVHLTNDLISKLVVGQARL